MQATLAEVGGRLAAAGETVAAIGITNQRETLVAFDRSTGQPLHRAIVWQDRRSAAICAELTEAGHLPLVRATTGLVLDPYFSATKASWLLRSGELALAPDDPDLSFCTVDTWVLWNLTGGAAAAASTPPTPPTPAAPSCSIRPRLAWSPELCDLFGVPRTRCPSCGRRPAGSAPPRSATSAPRRPSSTASPSRACSATSRPRCSGRRASNPAW